MQNFESIIGAIIAGMVAGHCEGQPFFGTSGDGKTFVVTDGESEPITGMVTDHEDMVKNLLASVEQANKVFHRVDQRAGEIKQANAMHEHRIQRLAMADIHPMEVGITTPNYEAEIEQITLEGLRAKQVHDAFVVTFYRHLEWKAMFDRASVEFRRDVDSTVRELAGLREHIRALEMLAKDPSLYAWIQTNSPMPGYGQLTRSWVEEMRSAYIHETSQDHGPTQANTDDGPTMRDNARVASIYSAEDERRRVEESQGLHGMTASGSRSGSDAGIG